MAKLTGPLLSLEARGTMAKILEYQTRHGRGFIRKHQQPTGAPSTRQIGQRAYYLEATQKWQTLTTGERLQWTTFNNGN